MSKLYIKDLRMGETLIRRQVFYAAGDTVAVGSTTGVVGVTSGEVTGSEGVGGVGLGISVELPCEEFVGLAELFSEGDGDGLSLSSGDGVGDSSSKSPKMSVGAIYCGALKVLYGRFSLSGAMIFFHVWVAGFPLTYMGEGVLKPVQTAQR